MIIDTLRRLLTNEGLALLQFLVLLYFAGAAAALLLGDRMMFLPPPASYGDDPELLRLRLADGTRIAALHLDEPDAGFTILYSHGNAEDLGHIRPRLETLRSLGFAVLAYDYRGYGLSEGRPSARGAREEAEAAYRYLTGELGVAPDRVIVYGRSVGGGPATAVAASHPVGGLVLESTFVSAYRVVTRVPIFPFDRFRNLRAIGRVNAPVLIIHGTADGIIPFWHGRRLYEAAAEPKHAVWVEGAGHNDLRLVADEQWRRALLDFARTLQPAS